MGDIARNENFEISGITVLRLRAIWQRFCRTDFPKTKALDVLERLFALHLATQGL
jgi:hypothetical protein